MKQKLTNYQKNKAQTLIRKKETTKLSRKENQQLKKQICVQSLKLKNRNPG